MIHKTMTKVIQFIVVVAFLLIIYRKKIKTYVQARKEAKLSGISGNNTAGNVPTAFSALRSGAMPAATDQISVLLGNLRHDFIVLDLTENLMDTRGFEERLTDRLAIAESDLREGGYSYHVDFMTIGTALIVVITYGIQQ